MAEHYLGHRKRLKEKFMTAPEGLFDYEVLELLIGYIIKGKDVKPIAKDILNKYGSLSKIFKENIEEIKGVGEESKIFFSVLKECYKRISFQETKDIENILSDPDSVYRFLKFSIGFADVEHFYAIFLNSSNAVISFKEMFKGTVNQSAVYIREILEEAIKNKAVSVIIAHNHPSGNIKPSQDDINITKKVSESLTLVGMNLLDHLIVTSNSYLSMKKEKII